MIRAHSVSLDFLRISVQMFGFSRASNLVSSGNWFFSKFCWLLCDMAFCHWQNSQAKSVADVYMCIAANSYNFANTGVLVTSVKNFPENRGVLLGLLRGFAGLNGAIMTQIYLALYGNNPRSLIFLIAWLPAAISVAFVYSIRTISAGRQPNEVRVLYQFIYVLL
ncbi:hypothetical protein POM88_036386 [Heracleum sosnowskyi]|uniref:Nodulin-like domain-containing protein n=1 Tax=Heracleum sosnowskyi TaxID=360622 RepID=A0AAD8MF02_9APIA|nr:hypothetical protein POM88_036386 [Heracleum sosnowskyi]